MAFKNSRWLLTLALIAINHAVASGERYGGMDNWLSESKRSGTVEAVNSAFRQVMVECGRLGGNNALSTPFNPLNNNLTESHHE